MVCLLDLGALVALFLGVFVRDDGAFLVGFALVLLGIGAVVSRRSALRAQVIRARQPLQAARRRRIILHLPGVGPVDVWVSYKDLTR